MFNKETEYAFRGLVYIQIQNLDGRRPGVAEIAEEVEAPPSYTAKILHRMVKSGFISSIKGKGGGFFFEKDKNDLTLREIILNIEGEEKLTGCGFGLKRCDIKNPCPLHDDYAPVRDSINALVQRETIQSLALKYAEKNSGGKKADLNVINLIS